MSSDHQRSIYRKARLLRRRLNHVRTETKIHAPGFYAEPRYGWAEYLQYLRFLEKDVETILELTRELREEVKAIIEEQ